MKTLADAKTIRAGAWEADILPWFGANTVRLEYRGKPVLRAPRRLSDLLREPVLYGMPILLPANRTFFGVFVFQGKMHYLPLDSAFGALHGTVLSAPFTCLKADERTVVCRLRNRNNLYYPYPFTLTVTDTLTENGYMQSYCLQNDGDTPMPYVFGLHTTFHSPEYVQVCVGAQEYAEAHPAQIYERDARLKADLIRGLQPQGVCLHGFYRADSHVANVGSFRYIQSENFDHWIFYNAGGRADYLSVEPQAGAVNGLRIPNGHCVLPPQASVVYQTMLVRQDELK